AAEQSAARAAHIQKWRSLSEQQRGEFEKVLDQVQDARNRKHFREAQALLAAFLERARGAEPECEFAKDRWHDLFYDDASGQESQAVAAEAKAALNRVEQEATAVG